MARLQAQKKGTLQVFTHCGVPFNICAPARLGRLEAILMPYLHFLLQDLIQGHFYRFPALVMSLELLHKSRHQHGSVYICTAVNYSIVCMHSSGTVRLCKVLLHGYNCHEVCCQWSTHSRDRYSKCVRHPYLIKVISSLLNLFKRGCMFNSQAPAYTHVPIGRISTWTSAECPQGSAGVCTCQG